LRRLLQHGSVGEKIEQNNSYPRSIKSDGEFRGWRPFRRAFFSKVSTNGPFPADDFVLRSASVPRRFCSTQERTCVDVQFHFCFPQVGFQFQVLTSRIFQKRPARSRRGFPAHSLLLLGKRAKKWL
jgi:hypothetical protein